MDVLLLNMPFVSLARPAIGISLLKACLAEEGFACSIAYGSLFFAEWVGLTSYELILDRISPAMFAGDWLFSRWLFPGRDDSVYLATLRRQLTGNDADFALVLAMREQIGPFLEACLSRFQVARFDIVGFTTTFEQNLASLALARLIKTTYPEKTVVFGGANCEGVMGLELHRQFPWIDYVCSGESDNSFPSLVKRLASRQPPDGVAGLIHRHSGASCLSAPPDRIHDMDRLPDPDYSDYFAALGASSLAPRIRPALLIETARGCWWGAKSHCTFCGLNGSTMAFRAKSAARVYAELVRQKARYGIGRFLAVDNIMSYEYFRDLLPMLKHNNPGVSLFYEIKSNLKRDQIELLRDAGVLALQPGVESLSSHVLRLMRKGVTAIQNVQLLRLCREYGIQIAWNLLYGFPGETPEDYAETARTIAAISHLKPPGMAAPIRLDRFSPNYNEAEHFGLVTIHPFSMYPYIYPLPAESVANLAYFFEYRYADGRDPELYMQPVLDRVREWQRDQTGDLIKRYGGDSELTLVDTRVNGAPRNYPLNGSQREIYDFCDEIQSGSSIADFAAARGAEPVSVDSFLRQLVESRLMLREGNQYLGLAVNTGRRGSSQMAAEAATF
ncbi:MAG TPA: RiPP maturation radical SAM C-methyltransferase [Bryobacteraceae bacterium]|nr:RiPP maturation radical SAM C-methyltransferase [Bryobacteraceae bacterium]